MNQSMRQSNNCKTIVANWHHQIIVQAKLLILANKWLFKSCSFRFCHTNNDNEDAIASGTKTGCNYNATTQSKLAAIVDDNNKCSAEKKKANYFT